MPQKNAKNPNQIQYPRRYPYHYHVHRCPVCDGEITNSRYRCSTKVAPLSIVEFFLCMTCGEQNGYGFTRAQRNKLEENIEAYAVKMGLVKKGGA